MLRYDFLKQCRVCWSQARDSVPLCKGLDQKESCMNSRLSKAFLIQQPSQVASQWAPECLLFLVCFGFKTANKKENKGASGQACVLRACSSSVLLSCACLGLNFLLVQARRKKRSPMLALRTRAGAIVSRVQKNMSVKTWQTKQPLFLLPGARTEVQARGKGCGRGKGSEACARG